MRWLSGPKDIHERKKEKKRDAIYFEGLLHSMILASQPQGLECRTEMPRDMNLELQDGPYYLIFQAIV